MSSRWRTISILLVCLLVGACGSHASRNAPPPNVASATAPAANQNDSKTVLEQAVRQDVAKGTTSDGVVAKTVDGISFANGKAGFDDRERELLQRHASILKNNPKFTLTLIPHVSNQGSHNYSLALTERWMTTITQTLCTLGAKSKQIRKVRIGTRKAHPACTGKSCPQMDGLIELILKK